MAAIFSAIENSANGDASEKDIKSLFVDFDTTSNCLGNTLKDKNLHLAAVLTGIAMRKLPDAWQEKHDYRPLSAANASLYSLTAAVRGSMGFIPQLGFVHVASTLPFIYDAADLYKHETGWPAAFESIALEPADNGEVFVRKLLKQKIEGTRMLRRMPEDLKKLFEGLGEAPENAPPDPPLQPHL